MSRSKNIILLNTKARSLAFSGVMIAISLLCLVLFRGVLSIVQAIIIPVVIVLFSYKLPRVHILANRLSLLVLSLIIFPVQVVFVLTYLLMAAFLQGVCHYSNLQPIRKWTARIFYFLFIGFMLYIGIIMTDIILGTHLNEMMRQLSRGNYMIYFVIILIEALIVSTIHIVSLYIIRRRINKIEKCV